MHWSEAWHSREMQTTRLLLGLVTRLSSWPSGDLGSIHKGTMAQWAFAV
jgi:hypothetical protein